MALIRAEIRNRLGDCSIYDGIVEYQSDFQTEPMLASMHYGSMMLCLNFPEDQNNEDEPPAIDVYVKCEDGSWKIMGSAGGSGAQVTAEAVAAAIEDMTPEQAAQVLSDLGGLGNPDPVLIWPTIVDHESEDGVSLSGYYDQDETPILNVGGSIDGESARITGLRAPSGDYDAANKKYVDDAIAATSSVLYVNLTNRVGVLTADKTYAEILAAYQAGKVVVVMYLHMAFYLSEEQSDNYGYLLFDHVQLGGDGGIIDELVVNFADEWSTAHISFDRGIVHTTIIGATPTITPEDNNFYHCGTLTSLTLNNPSSAEKYSILFISGSTPTVVTGIDNFTVEANKRYKINVEYGYATFDSWTVSGV